MDIHQSRVEQFMKLAKQDIPDSPEVPDAKIRLLRARLILEEAYETIQALGCDVIESVDPSKKFDCIVEVEDSSKIDLSEVLDGLADISVVCTGCASSCGVDMEPILEEVDNNNLSKFGPGHSIRSDGKLIKPPNFKGPDIQKHILEQIENKSLPLFK